jgi:hypothetical protein
MQASAVAFGQKVKMGLMKVLCRTTWLQDQMHCSWSWVLGQLLLIGIAQMQLGLWGQPWG